MPVELSALELTPAPVRAGVSVDLGDLVSSPNVRAASWQTSLADDAFTKKPPVEDSEDLRRIIALPRRPMVEARTERGDALIQLITKRYSNGRAAGQGCRCAQLAPHREKPCITTLKVAQAWALYEIGIHSGLLGPIGVGHGKTILDLMTPLALRDCATVVLLVPPGLVDQLIAEYELVGEHFRMPSLVIHGRDWTNVVPGAPVLHVFPYSRLSRPTATTFFETLQPDAVIADEVHKLRHADTATTYRVLSYFHRHPATRFCGWSGSITDASIKDYAHLSALALRGGSPLPLKKQVVEDWSRAIDPGIVPAPAGALLELCEPEEHVHSGFQRRLLETPGVVSTSEPAVDCELVIEERDAPALPESVKKALRELRGAWVRPDGEEFADPLEVVACALQLACGFYYRWRFPFIDGEPQKVEVIEEWLAARKAWNREVRDRLKDRSEHLDSPDLCSNAAQRAWALPEHECPKGLSPLWYRKSDHLPMWRAHTWPRWLRAMGTIRYETEAVRLDDFLARDAATWAQQNRGVVWYSQRAFGTWVAELSGLPMFGGGKDAALRLVGGEGPKGVRVAGENGKRSVICSIKSHGTGRDGLQRLFDDQLIANPPSSGTEWEQLLGRLHRIGQRSPRVDARFYRHTPELKKHVDKALARALYVIGTLGSAQKLQSFVQPDAGIDFSDVEGIIDSERA